MPTSAGSGTFQLFDPPEHDCDSRLVATRDTAKEISGTTKEIRDSHIAANAAGAIEETAEVAVETVHAAEETVRQAPKTAPKTIKTARKGATKTSKAVDATSRKAKSQGRNY